MPNIWYNRTWQQRIDELNETLSLSQSRAEYGTAAIAKLKTKQNLTEEQKRDMRNYEFTLRQENQRINRR